MSDVCLIHGKPLVYDFRSNSEVCRLCSNPEQVGKAVDCNVCGRCKAPRGRSAPLDMASSLCDNECEGYNQSPLPGELWPGETREDFGY